MSKYIKRAIENWMNIGTVSKATLGGTSEGQGGAHNNGLFRVYGYHLEVN